MKRKYKILLFIILISIFIGINIVEAETTGTLNFCKYAGTRRALKIVGIIFYIVKVVVPLILMGMCIYDFFKPMLSGKSDDLMLSAKTIIRRFITAVVVFLIPSFIHEITYLIVDENTSDFVKCEKCIYTPNSCKVDEDDADNQDANNIYVN